MTLIKGRINFRPFRHQLEVMRCPKRHRCAVFHRRAGKTVMAVFDGLETMLSCPLPSPRVYYIAPTLRQAKKIAWDYLRDVVKRASREQLFKINESELSVTFLPNNGKFQLLGANDNVDTIRGVYADKVIVDELADCHPGLWSSVLRPALADRKGRALMLGTPRGRMNFLYELSKIDAEDPEWAFFKYNCLQTGVLDQDEIDNIRRDMLRANPAHGESLFQQELMVSFNAALIGAIYGQGMDKLQSEGRFTSVQYDAALPVMTAWDLGYKDATAIWFLQQVGSEIRAIEYCEYSFTSLPDIIRAVKARAYLYSEHFGPHDLRVHEYGSGRTRLDIASDFDIDFILAPNWSREEGIEAVQALLPNLWIDHKLADRGLECLCNYQFDYDETRKAFKVIPAHTWASHGCDALRYFATARDNALPARGGSRQSRWLF